MTDSADGTMPPMDDSEALRKQTIEALVERSKRHGTVGIRQAFLQTGRGRKAGAGPLARFVRDELGLDLYLLLLLLGRGNVGGHSVTLPSGTWIRALGLTGPNAEQALSRAFARLEARNLIRRTRTRRGLRAQLLCEDGQRGAYSPPATEYFQLPLEYWTADHYKNMPLSGKLMLLVALGEPEKFELPIARVRDWYGLSDETARRGLNWLNRHGFVLHDTRVVTDLFGNRTAKRQATFWQLQGSYHRDRARPPEK